MKVMYSVVFLITMLAATYGYPATKNDEKNYQPNTEYDFVPLEAQRPAAEFLPPGGVVDVDAGGFFGSPFGGNPFPSLLSSIEGIMARMRQQLNQILGRLPTKAGESPFPELHIPNIGDIDLGKGNTTSVTKIIDGHKVTINETEYKKDSENGASFFKVRVVDVHPDSEEASTERDSETQPAKGERESIEETLSNEISKTKNNEETNFDNIETFDEVDVGPQKATNMRRNIKWNDMRSVESIEDNSIDAGPQPIRDLSNDIYVNQLLSNSGAPTNPDAEVFEVFNGIPSLAGQHNNMVPQTYPSPKREMVESHVPIRNFEEAMFNPNVPYFPQPMFPLNNQHFHVPPPNQQFMNQPPPFPLFQPNMQNNPVFLPIQEKPFPPKQNHFKNLNSIPYEGKTSQRIEKRESSLTSNESTQVSAEVKSETAKLSAPST